MRTRLLQKPFAFVISLKCRYICSTLQFYWWREVRSSETSVRTFLPDNTVSHFQETDCIITTITTTWNLRTANLLTSIRNMRPSEYKAGVLLSASQCILPNHISVIKQDRQRTYDVTQYLLLIIIIIIIIIIIFINCNWVVTRWQWLFDTHTKYDIGLLLNLRREGYMRSMKWQLGMLGTVSAFA